MKELLKLSANQPIYFTSDTHFGHHNIIRYCQRPFSCVEEMNETIIKNWNDVVGKDDIIFHLGDFGVGGSAEWSRLLERLNGEIHLILGNHDLRAISTGFSRFKNIAMQKIIDIGNQRIYLNHYPFLCYGGAYRKTWQLFGHVHTNSANTGKDNQRLKMLFPMQYDVGVDNNNFTPVSFEQVKSIIAKQIEESKKG